MPKNIVLCSDGTGGTVMKNRGTNVWKIFEAIDVNGHKHGAGVQQIAFYDDGIGTEQMKTMKALGGGIGLGLGRNIRQLYTMLCRSYEPGDKIFLFGFSRGAYTVRILARLITRCGVIGPVRTLSDAELETCVEKAYKVFRKHHFRRFERKPDAPDAAAVELKHWLEKEKNTGLHENVHVTFLGVWDTVSAIGLPFKGITRFWNAVIFPFRFADETLDPNVDKACHALAIDDERHTFHPEVWQEKDETRPERIEQVWFAGVHSNVGGGYAKQGMSLVSLDWMTNKAEDRGLRFIKSMCQNYCDLQNVNDKLYDSRAGMAVYFRYKPRDIARICRDKGLAPRIHYSVFERLWSTTDGYAPGNLPSTFEIVRDPKATASAVIGVSEVQGLAERMNGNGKPISEEDMQSVTDYMESGTPLTPAARRAVFDDVGTKLLDKVRFWIGLRKFAQYLFYAITLAVIGSIFYFELYSLPLSQGSGFGKAVVSVVLLICVLLVLSIPYVIGHVGRTRMQKTFSDFWRKMID